MTISEKQRQAIIGKAILQMVANFNSEMPDYLLEKWLQLLAPYPVQAVLAAIDNILLTYKFKTMPPLAEIVERIDGGQKGREQTLAMKAEAEWDLLLENIGRFGWMREPDMHPTTAHVLRAMGGWQTACSWENSSLEWKHKDFVQRWQQADGNVELMQGGALAIEAHIKKRLALKSVDEAMGLPKGKSAVPEEIRTQWEQLLAEEQRLQQGLAMAQAGR